MTDTLTNHVVTAEPINKLDGGLIGYTWECSCGRRGGHHPTAEVAEVAGRNHTGYLPEDLFDWRGTPIEVGCTVVYPGYGGSHQWVTEGKVKAIKKKTYWRGTFPYLMVEVTSTTGSTSVGRVSSVHSLDRVTVVPERTS